MVDSPDLMIVLLAAGAFIVFLIIHFLTFRFLAPEALLKGIVNVFVQCLLGLFAIGFFLVHEPVVNRILMLLLTAIIYGLLSFFYILCIFGPYETSIRMRLIRELSLSVSGLSINDLLTRYNVTVILDTRIQRLIGSGDLIKKNDLFYLGKASNMFFIIDRIASKLRRFIHQESSRVK